MNEDKISLSENPWVEKDEKIMAGATRIAGTRIRVLDVIDAREKLDYSPEKIAKEFGVSRKQVSKALSYYEIHKKEVEKEKARIKKLERRLKADKKVK